MRRLIPWSHLLLWPTVLATILSFLGSLHWRLDLFTHFHAQYLFLSVLAALFALLNGRWRLLWFGLGSVLINLMTMGAVYRPLETPKGEGIELLIANVNTENRDFIRLANLIREEDPEIIGLIEVDEAWLKALRPGLLAWPHRFEIPRDDNFGLALYSKRPFEGFKMDAPETKLPSIRGEFGDGLNLILIHAPPPINQAWSEHRDALLLELSKRPEPRLLIAGDFNATLWSRSMVKLLQSGFEHGRRGRWLQPSWPADLGILGIPIDHLLLRGGLHIQDHLIGPEIGSDHLPLLVKILL